MPYTNGPIRHSTGRVEQEVRIAGHSLGGCLPCRKRSWKEGEQNDGLKTVKIASKDVATGTSEILHP